MTSAARAGLPRSPACAFAIEPAKFGTASLRQHELRVLDDGGTFVLAMALGPPRLWSYLTKAVLDGFEDGFGRAHDGRASTRLHQGLLVAQQAVRDRAESLIERRLPDVALLALSLEGELLHVLGGGPLRAYVLRRTALRALCAKSEHYDGVIKQSPTWCAEPIEAGDLVIAASRSAFVEQALQAPRSLPQGAPDDAAEQLVSHLSAPARRDGLACACLALRVGAP